MTKKFETMKTRLMALIFVELVLLVLFHFAFNKYLYIVQYILILINVAAICIMFYYIIKTHKSRVLEVSQLLGTEARDAFDYGKIGIITLDNDNTISWMSEIFDELGIEGIGEKLVDVFPSSEGVLDGNKDFATVTIKGNNYEITSMGHKQIMFVKDITEITELERVNRLNSVVLGIANLDNYEETTQYEEEQQTALIDSNIRQAVVRWADKHNMFIRRIRPDRYLLVMNEEIYQNIVSERYSILHEIRKQSREMDVNITLSLAFARQSTNLKELEDMSNKALEMAQARGGDQVAINTKGSDITYFGGSSEAVEKRSKVRVRVVAQDLGNRIKQADNVIIVGHRMTDFDCFASALGVSSIVDVYGKKAHIVINLEDTDSNLASAITEHRESFEPKHSFIDKNEAKSMMGDNTLVIMVDHHSLEQTQTPELIHKAKRIIVIDHHRRTGEFKFKPELIYIESSASSASELVVELFPYNRKNVVISKQEATFMYTGMIIDTNRFRNRSGSRTFQAAAELRKFGADLAQVENMLRDDYVDFEMRNKILSRCELFEDHYVIAAYKDEPLPRTLMSQAADEILSVREVEASFVVASVDDDTIAISSRSKGDLNVQLVMERLGGGGHFTGAATVIKNKSFNEITEMLKEAIVDVRKESE